MSLRIVLACLLIWGLLGAAGYWLITDSPEALPTLGVGSNQNSHRDALRSKQLEVNLTQPASREEAAPVVGPSAATNPPAPEVPGLRLEGLVRDDETDEPVPGAHVFVHLEDTTTDERFPLGRTTSDGSGVVRLSLNAVARRPRREWKSYAICVRVEEEGYSPSNSSAGILSASGEVLRMDISLEASVRSVLGYVLGEDGGPVANAHVSMVAWGPRGIDPSMDSYTTEPDGHFSFEAGNYGRVNLMASHPSHGVAYAEGYLTPENPRREFELRLGSEGILSGRVIARDGTPLPGADLEAYAADDELDSNDHEISCGKGGRFRFAALTAGQYILKSSLLGGHRPVFTTDQTDLEIRVPLPTAAVRVVHMDGRLMHGSDVSVWLVEREGKAVYRRRSGAQEKWVFGGLVYLAFHEPGLYSISYTYESDGVHYGATELVAMAVEHKVVDLRLTPEERIAQPFQALGPEGESIDRYTVRTASLEDGAYLGSADSPAKRILARPGPARFSVKPVGATFVMPFEVDAEISEDRTPLVLRGISYGGHIRLDVGLEGSRESPSFAHIYSSAQKRMPALWIADGQITTGQPLPPGAYTVTTGAKGYKHYSEVMEVEAGKVTTSRAFLVRK